MRGPRKGQNVIGNRNESVISGVSRVRPAPSEKFSVVFGESRYEYPTSSVPSTTRTEPGTVSPFCLVGSTMLWSLTSTE
jgi:hypothetical protein